MNKLIYSFILYLFFAVTGCKKNNECKYSYPPVAADKYIYPVKPGSAEWNAAIAAGVGQSYPLDSVYKLCQIPENILQTMSTLGLIQSLEDNPCLFNMMLRDNIVQGRDEVLSRLNVSWVLNKRSDAGITLLKYYEAKDPNIISCIDADREQANYSINWYLFDKVCSQDSLLSKLDKPLKKRFANTIIDKYNIQLKYPNSFGGVQEPMIFILSRLMVLEGFQPFLNAMQADVNLTAFAVNSIFLVDYRDIYSKVLEFSNQFINS